MSDPVQAFVGIGAAVVALLLVMGGGFLVLAPRIVATRIAMQALAVAAPRAAAGMKALGIAAGTATAVLALVMAFDLLTRSTEFAGLGVEQFRVHIKALEDSGRATVDIENMRDAMERFQNTVKVAGLRVSTEWGSGLGAGTKASNDFRAALELVDQTIAGMVESGEIENFNSAVNRIADIFGISWNEAKRLVEQMPMLREAFASTKGEAAATAEAMTPLDQSLQNLADQFNLTGDESTKAAQEMINEWDGATRDFVDIMDAYKTVLDSAMEKQQDWAQGQADTFNEENPDSPSKSWEDYARDVEVSLGDVNKALEDQLVAMRDWQANLGTLAKRGVDDGLLSELARLGPEGAPLVKALADASDKELEKWVTLMGQRTTEGTNSVATNLIAAQPRLEEISNEMGQEVVNNIIDGMVKNGTTLEQEAERQGINVDKKLSKHGSLKIAPFLDKILFNNANLKLNNLARDRTMDITARITGYEYKGAGSASYPGNARGGEVRGPGGPSDDMAGLFRLSDREWVIRALAAMKYGRDRMRAVNEGTARIILPGEGGTSRFDLLTRGQFDATDFLNRIELAVTRVASSSAAVNGSPGAAGKVLPSGTYRIGRGPAGHGYNARDLPAPIGTPVFAAAAGIVSRAARLATSYGIHAVIQHAGWKTLYAHMSQMYVRAGQNIPRGFMLGRVGSTGNSTGPHLHLEPDLARLYDFGGYLPRGWSLAYNGTGGQERVLTPRESALYSKIVGALQIQTSRSTMPYQLPALPSRSVDQRSYWTINGAPEEIVAKVASRMAYDRIAKESPHD
jgi:murein DD-endopeptidase MepM/ murein hydrolase activator NlpD